MNALARRMFGWLLVMLCVTTACQAADNPLIGSWRWDTEKTLRNIHAPRGASKAVADSVAKARRFVEAAMQKAGYTTLTYSDHDYVQTLYDNQGNVLSRESAPYRLLQIEKNFVLIDQEKNGGAGKVFLEGSSFYVEVKVGEYTYRDYFTKL